MVAMNGKSLSFCRRHEMWFSTTECQRCRAERVYSALPAEALAYLNESGEDRQTTIESIYQWISGRYEGETDVALAHAWWF
jgi:hypothetical protein